MSVSNTIIDDLYIWKSIICSQIQSTVLFIDVI